MGNLSSWRVSKRKY